MDEPEFSEDAAEGRLLVIGAESDSVGSEAKSMFSIKTKTVLDFM